MTSTARNPRLPCPYCDTKLLCRDFGSHIFLKHKSELFSDTTESGQTNRFNLASQTGHRSPLCLELNGEKTYWCLACYNCAKRESMADKHMTTNKYNCKEKHPDLWESLAKEYPKVKGVKTVTEVVTPATRAIKRVVLDLLDEIHHLRGFIHLHRDEIKFTEDDDELFSYTYDIFDFDESPTLIQEYIAKPAKDLIDLDEDMMRLDCKRDISEFYRDLKTLLSKKEEQQEQEKPKEPEPEEDTAQWTETIESLESIPVKDRAQMAASMPLLKSKNAPLWFKDRVASLLQETPPAPAPAPPPPQPQPATIFGSKRRPKSQVTPAPPSEQKKPLQFPPNFTTQPEQPKLPTIISMTKKNNG